MQISTKKKTILLSIGIAALFLFLSLSSTVAYQSASSSLKSTSSPLFYTRLTNIINHAQNPGLSPRYVGENQATEIPLPTRELLTDDLLHQLASDDITKKIYDLNSAAAEKWQSLLRIAQHNLAQLNSFIRQDYSEYQRLLTEYSTLSPEEAQCMFFENLQALDLQTLQQSDTTPSPDQPQRNITSGVFCNITSGQFCQITTQPICQITTQPICLITKGFFCWTIYGPICPTTGIKCHPPTSRPTLCSIFAVAGKLLKTLIIVLLLATVIFVPLAILTLVLITVFNPDRCEQMHQRITMWFNCTTPQ
jgi:hypothetical protein